jgi:transcriptional regulator with XRE-family HTH domain
MTTGVELTQHVLANVERLRTAQGSTFAEVCEAAGVSTNYLYSVRKGMRGARGVTLDVVARLADALDVQASALLLQPLPRTP